MTPIELPPSGPTRNPGRRISRLACHTVGASFIRWPGPGFLRVAVIARIMTEPAMPRIGFLLNPIAGMGGRVALKGTDGAALAQAIERGAAPRAPGRAAEFLR